MAQRHHLDEQHVLNNMEFIDLQQTFKNNSIAFPGAKSFGLKNMAKALGEFNSSFETQWPEDLDAGSDAMVMGWEAYKNNNPEKSNEIALIQKYLKIDCLALWNILKALRYYSKKIID